MQRRNDASMPVVPRIAMGNRQVFGFPPTLLTKLRYVDTYPLVSTSGSLAKQLFKINSIFDPDSSGVGHQPLYRDTYAAIYDYYAVVSVKATVQFQSLNTSSGSTVGILIDDDTSTSTNANVLMEQNYGKKILLPPVNGSLSNRTLTLDWDCKKILNIDPFTSQAYRTAQGSDPTELSTLLVWSASADGTSTGTVQAMVTLEFTVIFSELTTPTVS